MNQHQLRYAVAKAALDALHAEVREQMGDLAPNATEEEIERYTTREMQIEQELGYDTIFNEWCEARQALLDWGKSVTLRIATPDQRPDLEMLFANLDNHPVIRERVIDLAFRLNA